MKRSNLALVGLAVLLVILIAVGGVFYWRMSRLERDMGVVDDGGAGIGARYEKDGLTFDRLGEEAQMEVEGD